MDLVNCWNYVACYALTQSLGVRPFVSNKGLALVLVNAHRSLMLTQLRVQGLGTAQVWSSEGVFPKKSLQWTSELVIK